MRLRQVGSRLCIWMSPRMRYLVSMTLCEQLKMTDIIWCVLSRNTSTRETINQSSRKCKKHWNKPWIKQRNWGKLQPRSERQQVPKDGRWVVIGGCSVIKLGRHSRRRLSLGASTSRIMRTLRHFTMTKEMTLKYKKHKTSKELSITNQSHQLWPYTIRSCRLTLISRKSKSVRSRCSRRSKNRRYREPKLVRSSKEWLKLRPQAWIKTITMMTKKSLTMTTIRTNSSTWATRLSMMPWLDMVSMLTSSGKPGCQMNSKGKLWRGKSRGLTHPWLRS